ncbi:MAG: 50S ribosomal protein L25 [Gemmataceae bacterium]|nr:50S ribosomal protein L25 [Gemmataceae bacterium]
MAETVELATQTRKPHGSNEARRLRRKGLIPAVVYGHEEGTVAVTLAGEDLEKAIRHGARVVDLKSDGKVQKALIREVQWDHLGKELLHVDFARVAIDERVVLDVRVELRGIAPGVTAGGALDQPLHQLSIECLAISVPDHIRVNIGELQIGQSVHVRDLVLPEGVKAMVDADAIVVQVKAPVVEATAGGVPGAPGTETAEPEVIGRKVAAEEEAE